MNRRFFCSLMLGGLAIYILPVAQYPNIAPPSVAITARYPGASAETVENSVTQVIEQNLSGLDGLIYLTSSSDSSGNTRIELTFMPGVDADIAWAKVQNKVQPALAALPDAKRVGIILLGDHRKTLFPRDADGNDIRTKRSRELVPDHVLRRIARDARGQRAESGDRGSHGSPAMSGSRRTDGPTARLLPVLCQFHQSRTVGRRGGVGSRLVSPPPDGGGAPGPKPSPWRLPCESTF